MCYILYIKVIGVAFKIRRYEIVKKSKNKNEHLIESITMMLTAFVWNELVYLGARFITGSRRHYDMTTALDRRIPFLPWTITIYFGCFVFWTINYYLCSKQ